MYLYDYSLWLKFYYIAFYNANFADNKNFQVTYYIMLNLREYLLLFDVLSTSNFKKKIVP